MKNTFGERIWRGGSSSAGPREGPEDKNIKNKSEHIRREHLGEITQPCGASRRIRETNKETTNSGALGLEIWPYLGA